MSRKVSPIWQHFEKFGDDRVKCKVNDCGECVQNNYTCAKQHLLRIHKIYTEEDRLKWENDKYLLWQHFSKGKPFEARCELCSFLLIKAFKPDIERHLISYHKDVLHKIQAKIQEEIARIGLSQHFKFEDSFATCKLQQNCNFKVKIYKGINVLKCHWRSHKVQHSVYEETYAGQSFYRNNYTYWPPLGYPEGYPMIQHSVDVENYAGPSSYRDNYTYWSPALGYPEGYRMIQHSINVGNHAGPSSYYNNSHLHSLGNEGGQQSGQQGPRSPDKFWRPW